MSALILLLQLLKIALFLVLSLLIIIMLIVLIILCVPFKYTLYAKKRSDYSLEITVTWFFKLLKVTYFKNNKKPGYSIIILGIDLKKLSLRGNRKPNNVNTKNDDNSSTQNDKIKDTPKSEDLKSVKSNTEYINNSITPNGENLNDKSNGASETDFSENVKHKPDITKKFKTKKCIKPKNVNDSEKKSSIRNKLKDILNNINYILDYPDKRKILERCTTLLKRILLILKPDVLKAQGYLGFENPQITAYMLAVQSIIRAFTDFDILLHGNFNNEDNKLDLHVKGKIFLLSLIIALIKFIFCKPIWKITKGLLKLLFRKEVSDEQS